MNGNVDNVYKAIYDAFQTATSDDDVDKNCRVDDMEFMERLAANALTEEEEKEFFEHMAKCNHCRSSFAQLVNAGAFDGSPWMRRSEPTSFISRVKTSWSESSPLARALTSAAAVLAIAVGGYWAYDSATAPNAAPSPAFLASSEPFDYNDCILDYLARSILDGETLAQTSDEKEIADLYDGSDSYKSFVASARDGLGDSDASDGDSLFMRVLSDALVERKFESAREEALVLKSKSDDYEVELLLGVTELGLNRYDAAVVRFEDALALEPNCEVVSVYYAYALYKTQKKESVEKAVKIAEYLAQYAQNPHVRDLAKLVLAIRTPVVQESPAAQQPNAGSVETPAESN